MSVLNPGTTFSNGEQLTASDLNLLLQQASFTQSSIDNQSTQLVGTAIVVADGGIIASKLAPDSVTTSKILDADVTFAKIENVADYKVLGNVSGAAAAPAEVAVLDEDDMVSDSATALATQQSIKAYVDSNGITQTTGTAPYYGCRAFASYNGVTQTLNNGANIASVTRNGVSNYTFVFDIAMPDTNYSVVTGCTNTGVINSSYIAVPKVISKTNTTFNIKVSGSGPSGGDTDQTILDVSVFR